MHANEVAAHVFATTAMYVCAILHVRLPGQGSATLRYLVLPCTLRRLQVALPYCKLHLTRAGVP